MIIKFRNNLGGKCLDMSYKLANFQKIIINYSKWLSKIIPPNLGFSCAFESPRMNYLSKQVIQMHIIDECFADIDRKMCDTWCNHITHPLEPL
jgi:hypothetical protein